MQLTQRYLGVLAPFLSITLFLPACAAPAQRTTPAVAVELNGPADGNWQSWLAPPDETAPQPRLVCTEPNLITPPAWEGTTSVFNWELLNTGQAPLRLCVVACGGTLRGPAGRTIRPGGRERIEATGASAAVYGSTNEQGNKPFWLRAKPSQVLHALRCSGRDWSAARRVLHFAVERSAGPQTRTLLLERGDGGKLAPKVLGVERVPVQGQWEQVPFNASAQLHEIVPGEQYELEITVSPPWANGSYIGVVHLATGVRQQPTVDLEFWPGFGYRVTAKLTGWPVPRERTAMHEITGRFTWSEEAPPGRILSVTCDQPDIACQLAERDREQILLVRIPPHVQPPDSGFYDLRFRTDDASAPEFRHGIPFEKAAVAE